MKSRCIRNIVVYFLLWSYLTVGVAGYLKSITLLGFGTNPEIITKASQNTTPTVKVFWTQHKHIPSTTKISVPSPAIFTPPESPRVWLHILPLVHSCFPGLANPTHLYHSPRSPPQV